MAPCAAKGARRIDVQDMGLRAAHERGAKNDPKPPVAFPQPALGDPDADQHRMTRLAPKSGPDGLYARPKPKHRRTRERHVCEEDQDLSLYRPQRGKPGGEAGGQSGPGIARAN